MFYHVQIWRTRRPVFSDDVVGLFAGRDDSGKVACDVIAMDEVFGWVSLLERQDDVTKNFNSVLGCGRVAFDDL